MKTYDTRRQFLKYVAAAGAYIYLGAPRRLMAAENSDPLVVDGKPIFKFRSMSVSHLPELRHELEETLRQKGVSTEKHFRSYVEKLDCALPKELGGAKSLIVAALPIKIAELFFHLNGQRRKVVIPPGYVTPAIDGKTIESKQMMTYLKTHYIKNPKANLVSGHALPMKLAAAHSGLGKYGRNNICYVDGMGSFHALFVFFTDEELADNWGRKRILRECKGCDICIRDCPTNCISPDRFPIDVSKCVTLYNELPDPMPDWMPKTAHSALVGCTKCQFTCPGNKAVMSQTEQFEDITEEETQMILSGKKNDALKASIDRKLERIGLTGDLAHLAKNLKLLV